MQYMVSTCLSGARNLVQPAPGPAARESDFNHARDQFTRVNARTASMKPDLNHLREHHGYEA